MDRLTERLNDVITNVPDKFLQDEEEFNPFLFWQSDAGGESAVSPDLQDISKRKEELQEAKNQIEYAVKQIVNEYYKPFNQATTSFSKILESFKESSTTINSLEANLLESQELLKVARGGKGAREDLQHTMEQLWKEALVNKKILENLEKMEHVLNVPSVVELYFEKKQFVHAAHLLMDAMTLLMENAELLDIGNMREHHHTLLMLKEKLKNNILEELRTQIYFKTNMRSDAFDDNSRYSISMSRMSTNFGTIAYDEDESSNSTEDTSFRRSAISKRNSSTHPSWLDSSVNPSVNSRKLRMGENDPCKIVVPSFKSIRSVGTSVDFDISSSSEIEYHSLLLEETENAFLSNPELDQVLFIKICVAAITKLSSTVELKRHLSTNLQQEIQSMIEREIQTQIDEDNASKAERKPLFSNSSNRHSEKIVRALEKIFLSLYRIISSHLEVLKLINVSKDEDRNYNNEVVWQAIQGEVKSTLKKILGFGSRAQKQEIVEIEEEDDMVLTFSFSDAGTDALQDKRNRKATLIKEKENELAPSSPYHITFTYRPVINFIDQAEAMLAIRYNSDDSLRAFMKEFISNNFIQQIRADSKTKLKAIFREDCFSPSKLSPGEPQLVKCSIEICDLLRKIITDFFALVHFNRDVLLNLLENINNTFHDKCSERYQSLTKRNHSMKLTLSSQFVTKNFVFLIRDPDFEKLSEGVALDPGVFTEENQSFLEDKISYLLGFSNDSDSWKKLQLLNVNNFSSLILLSTSLTFIADQFPEFLNNPLSHNSNRPHGRSWGNRRAKKNPLPSGPIKPPRSLEKLRTLSDKALFTVRTALEIRCIYHLKTMTKNYELTEERTQPEPFVTQLNKELVLIEAKLDEILRDPHHPHMRFVFGSLAHFICDVFISLFGRIHGKVNEYGVKLIHRNLFSLQQNLTNIIQEAQEQTFDRARHYVDLCMLPEEEIMDQRNSSLHVFSDEQWDVAISRAKRQKFS